MTSLVFAAGCGGGTQTAQDGGVVLDAAYAPDTAQPSDAGSSTVDGAPADATDATVDDGAVDAAPVDSNVVDAGESPDAEFDAALVDADVMDADVMDATLADAADPTPNDASADGGDTGVDDGGTPDASVPFPAMYRIEVWGFSVPTLLRRHQEAAPGYTDWQTHDPEASPAALRAPDVRVGLGVSVSMATSATFENTFVYTPTTTPIVTTAAYAARSVLDDLQVFFFDYEQNGEIVPPPAYSAVTMWSCMPGWMTASAIDNALLTGNIQTTSCPGRVHASGTPMHNAAFVVQWRIVPAP